MASKKPRLQFTEDSGSAADSRMRKPAQPKLLTDEQKAKARKEQLRFGKKENAAPVDLNTRQGVVRKGVAKRDTISARASSSVIKREAAEANQDENVGTQALQEGVATAEGSIREIENARYSHKLRQVEKAGKLEKKADKANLEAQYREAMDKADAVTSNPISRWQQRRKIRKEYYEAKNAVQNAANTAKTARSVTERLKDGFEAIRTTLSTSTGLRSVLAVAMAFLLIVAPFQSCSVITGGVLTTVTATSWPADDIQITRADAYYTKLEAQLQKKINTVESRHPGCEEYHYNLSEIGHDPTMLISYLCAKYQDFTFNQVKSELETIFNLQYHLSEEIRTETRVTTRTVQVGDYIGQVVTSAYCSCPICCGIWSGGPTASGVYPRANHTIAVDANNPRLPMGTEIIMNGTLYKVEDTGNFARYGVDFDVYYDSHQAALNHGHQTWDAYYAGGNGGSITITEEESVDICYVTLTASDFESVLLNRLNAEQREMYDIYQITKGNRIMFGSPVDLNWHNGILYGYGYQCSGDMVIENSQMEVLVPSGTPVLSVMDGQVVRIASGVITLKNEKGYTVKIGGCTNITVPVGTEVTKGQPIAQIGSAGKMTLSFSYRNNSFNPYFYLNVGSILDSVEVEATGKAAQLIAKAEQYLGTPYVWGGYSPSGFDCSGFVSYVVNNCGAGFSFGRLTAESWRQQCSIISASQARPGDLIFFQGTYNTSGASHVGIYLGDGKMIHCGNPVKISSINTAYWQQHFYCYGRIPGM